MVCDLVFCGASLLDASESPQCIVSYDEAPGVSTRFEIEVELFESRPLDAKKFYEFVERAGMESVS